MSDRALQKIHSEAVHLSVLLRTLHTALPDDVAGSDIDTRFIVGWAYRLAEQLGTDLDRLSLSLSHFSAVNGGVERE